METATWEVGRPTPGVHIALHFTLVPMAVLGLSVWGPVGLVGGIQSEQVQVSYYELYYAGFWF